MPLIKEIERILGPFFLPTHPSAASVDSDDWEGAYTADYRIPEELKTQAELAENSKQLPKRSVASSPSDVVRFDAANEEYSKNKKEALTEALAFAHSRSMCLAYECWLHC